jgi:hypothetical protein
MADSLSAIKYAKVTPIRDEKGLAVDFKVGFICMTSRQLGPNKQGAGGRALCYAVKYIAVLPHCQG